MSSFQLAATTYKKSAVVQKEIGTRLMERLQYFKIQPEHILDLGAGPGVFTLGLKKMYPKASVIAFDISINMLKQIRYRLRRYKQSIAGDMVALPFADNQFDFVFANQVLHWASDLSACLGEIRRVLKPGGLLLFSSLGPDTFKEIRESWALVDDYGHANEFMDMHLLGDALMRSQFMDVVVDMEYLTTRYRGVVELVRDLKAQGVKNTHQQKAPGLTSPRRWRAFVKAYEHYRDEEALLPLTYEVVYGQAWCDMKKPKNTPTEFRVSIEDISRR